MLDRHKAQKRAKGIHKLDENTKTARQRCHRQKDMKMGMNVIKPVGTRISNRFLWLVGLFMLCAIAGYLAAAIIMSNQARADTPTRQAIKQMIVDHAKTHTRIDPALALAVARIMSNFDADAVGPAQRIGVFQLDPKRLGNSHHKAVLLDPLLNIKIGLNNLEHLIKVNQGDIAMALVAFNDGYAVGAWPNGRIVDYPAGFVANVFAARAVFEDELSRTELSRASYAATRLPLNRFYTRVPSNDIYHIYTTVYDTDLNQPRWRKKIAETRYWLDEANRIKRAQTW